MRKARLYRWLVALLALVCLAALARDPDPGDVLLNFQAADLSAVVKAMSEMTGRNMVVDPRAKGQVTIVSARPLPPAAAFQVFLAALRQQGFVAVDGPGGALRIVPAAEGKLSAPVTAGEAAPPASEQMITQIALLQHVPAAELQSVLRPLMSPTSQLSVYEPANALVITDFAANVRRLLSIVARVDLSASTDVIVVPLKHASAIDTAELVMRLASPRALAAPGAPGAAAIAAGADRFLVAPDPRTNSLLLRAENPARIAQLRSLIETLDVPARATATTRVVYLKHAEAAKLVEVLRGMLSATPPSAAGVAPGAPAPRPARSEPSIVQADPATNSIVINASDVVYNNLRSVIEQLDVRRAEVYVEALVVEMTADKAYELGIQWLTAGPAGSGAIGAMTNFPAANPGIAAAAANPQAALIASQGLSIAFLGREVTLPDGTVVRNLGALARALDARNMGNILSTPNLITLDNAQAQIVVGQNVPIVTGSYAQSSVALASGAAVNPFQTIERRDVGLTLKIKPQISAGGAIRLDIYQEVSSVDAAASVSRVASDVILNKRALETSVVVDDGNTIVLGGLIENNVQETTQAVPGLGRLPILGALFRFKQEIRTRTNLMVFLRPVIIRSGEDAYGISADRYQYLRAYTGREKDPEREAIIQRFQPTPPAPKAPPPAPAPAPAPSAPPSPDTSGKY